MKKRVAVNPNGRTTFQMPVEAYIVEFIIRLLGEEKEVSLDHLLARAEEMLSQSIGANLGFWVLKIKQELEAEEIIVVRRGLGLRLNQIIGIE